jgi:hypothetical protein
MAPLVAAASSSFERMRIATCVHAVNAAASSPALRAFFTPERAADASMTLVVDADASGASTSFLRALTTRSPLGALANGVGWAARYNAELAANTLRILIDRGSNASAPPSAATLGLVGEPALQLLPEYCTPAALPAAILADWLSPTLGTLVRAFVQGVDRGTSALAAYADGAPRPPEVEALDRLVRAVHNATRNFALPSTLAASVPSLREAFASGSTLAKRQVDAALDELDSVDAALVGRAAYASLTHARTPASARAHYLRALRAGVEKRSPLVVALPDFTAVEATGSIVARGRLSRWAARALARINSRATRLLRLGLFGTDDPVQLASIHATLTAGGDNATTAPCSTLVGNFSCCPGQAVCLNCSFLDRVSWALQDGTTRIARHYAVDVPERYGPCIEDAARSRNNLDLPPSYAACPDAVCAAAECTADSECIAFADGNLAPITQARFCHPLLRRCAYDASAGAPCMATTENARCLDDGGGDANASSYALGACNATGACVEIEANVSRACRCPDTLVTREPLIPSIGSRFTELETPCILNASCVLACILPTSFGDGSAFALATCSDGSACNRSAAAVGECAGAGECVNGTCAVRTSTNASEPSRYEGACTVDAECDRCFNNSFSGTWLERKTRDSTESTRPNADITLVRAADAGFAGAGSRFVEWIEDVAYTTTTLVEDTTLLAAYANKFLFCQYDGPDWFCELRANATLDDTGRRCCSDRCEDRVQGAGLLSGLVFGVLTLVVPVFLCTLCPCGLGSACTVVWPRLVTPFFWPIVLMYGYGGGFFCYSSGPALAFAFLAPFLASAVATLITCGCTCIIAIPRALTCNLVPDVSGLVAGVVRVLVLLVFGLFGLFAAAPGLPSCLGADVYTLANELLTPCASLFSGLIDLRLVDPTAPCTTVPTSVPYAQCATTDLLGSTRFLDGIDNILYLVEVLAPGANEALANGSLTTPALGFLRPYAVAHTSAAHASGGTYTSACFYVTLGNIVWGAFSALLSALAAPLVGAAILTALAVLLWVLALGGIAVFSMVRQMRRGYVERFDADGQSTYAGDGGGTRTTALSRSSRRGRMRTVKRDVEDVVAVVASKLE